MIDPTKVYHWRVQAPNRSRHYMRRDTLHGIKCHASLTYPGAYIELLLGGERVATKQPGGRWKAL